MKSILSNTLREAIKEYRNLYEKIISENRKPTKDEKIYLYRLLRCSLNGK